MHIRPFFLSFLAMASASFSFEQFMDANGQPDFAKISKMASMFTGANGQPDLAKMAASFGVDPEMAKMLKNEDLQSFLQTGDVTKAVKVMAKYSGLNEEEALTAFKQTETCVQKGDLNCVVDAVAPLAQVDAAEIKELLAPVNVCLNDKEPTMCIMNVLDTMIPEEIRKEVKFQEMRTIVAKMEECGSDAGCQSEAMKGAMDLLVAEIIKMAKEAKVQLPKLAVVKQQISALQAILPAEHKAKFEAIIKEGLALYERIYQGVNPTTRTVTEQFFDNSKRTFSMQDLIDGMSKMNIKA